MFELDSFFESMYQTTVEQQPVKTKEEQRALLKQSLGEFPNDDAGFESAVLETAECEGYTRERITIRTAKDLVMPLYVLTPEKQSDNEGQRPAILALHGHGYGSKEIVGLSKEGKERDGKSGIHNDFAVGLVKQGFKVFAPEVIGFGERMVTRDREKGKGSSCQSLATLLLMCGRTLAGLRVFEAIRTIDYICSDPAQAQQKIGIMGFSGGGLIAAYTSVLEQRIQATVLAGFPNTFRKSILAMDHCIDNYLPSILKTAELPHLMGLIAPRSLYIESGIDDPLFPLAGVKEAIAVLQTYYQAENAEKLLSIDLFQGGHEVHGKRAYQWLQEQLL